MTSLGKWAPLKLTAIVALPHDGPLSQGRIIPQIASNKNCDKTHAALLAGAGCHTDQRGGVVGRLQAQKRALVVCKRLV
jgi:hypothetical protein